MSMNKTISPQLSAKKIEHLNASNNYQIQIPYPTDKISFSRDGNTLFIKAENGETVQIKNFFVVDHGKPLPTLTLQDGSEVNTADFLHAMNPDMDITTAAGSDASAQGSGANDYSDFAGTLIGGFDPLGALESMSMAATTVSRISQPEVITALLSIANTSGGSNISDIPESPNFPNLPKGDSDLIVVHGKDINGVFIHGDSPSASELVGDILLNATANADTLAFGNRDNNIMGGSLVGGIVDTPDVWGNDTITIEANTIKGSTISGGKGQDILTINSGTTNSTFISGDEKDLTDTMGYAGDSIVINGTVNGNSSVGGDAGRFMINSTGGDSDSITITGRVSGNSHIGGDAGFQMRDSTGGNEDVITINGDMSNASIGGDAGHYMYNSTGGDRDIIVVNGNVTSSTLIGADSGRELRDGSTGGNQDSITINGNVSSNSYISGDAATVMDKSSGGDGDVVVITSNVSGSYIAGDAGYSMEQSTGGNGDSIAITGTVSEGSYIGGDVGKSMAYSTSGSDDTITINGNVSASYIGGNVGKIVHHSTGGDRDAIFIAGDVSDSYIGGDAGESMEYSIGGSFDSITITGTVSGNSFIGGDAGYFMHQSTGGDDYININILSGGTVSGDAYNMRNSIGGDDYITISTMQGGRVYGDGGEIVGPHTGGNDTISIDLFEGTASKSIDGGAGTDLFIYNSDHGHTITINNDNTVIIVDADGSNINTTTNTNIVGFEGIGGGSGNDILIGNNGDNLIIGGAGNDILTGGAGADTFAWGKDHQGTVDSPAIDIITDFSIVEGDVIDLSALLKGYSNGLTNITDYINVTNDGTNTILNISTNGTGAVDQVIQLQGISDLSADEIMANILLSGGL